MASLKKVTETMKTIRSERGVILITVLLLLMVVTLAGILAIDTSTIDLQIATNVKQASLAFEGAEAGIDLSIPIIERTNFNSALIPSAFDVNGQAAILDTANLANEILGGDDNNSDTAEGSPDIKIPNLSPAGNYSMEVNVDIDRLYAVVLEGSSMEFASGYEGIGAGAAGGGIGVVYRLTSQGNFK